MGLLRRLIWGEVPGDLGFIAQRRVIVGQEEGCSRTVSTPHFPPAAPTGAAGAGVRSICQGLGATSLWDRGLGPGSALLPGGEPHVLEGWWEKESTPSCLHLAVNPRKSPHTAPGGGEDCFPDTPKTGAGSQGPSLELFCLQENRKASTPEEAKSTSRQLSPLNQKPTTGLARIAVTVLSSKRDALAAQTEGWMDRQQLRSGWRWRLLAYFQS